MENKLYPTDIVEKALQVYPDEVNMSSTGGVTRQTIAIISREAYMRGMLNERLSHQNGIFEDYGAYCIDLVSGGYAFPSYSDFIKQYSKLV